MCILGMTQCCNGMYSGIVRNRLYCSVAVHTSLYLLVMHLTILAKSTSQFGTRYIWISTAQEAVKIQMYLVPNQNVDFARIVRCITRRYVQRYRAVQAVSYDTVVPEYVPLWHCANWVHTGLYLQFQHFYKYVPVCTWYVLVGTQQNQKMEVHNIWKSNQGSHA